MKRITAPRAPAPNDFSESPEEVLESRAQYDNFTLSGVSFAGQSAERVHINQAHFKRVNWGSTICPTLRLTDVRFSTCDLAAAQWHQSIWRRVVVEDSRLLGVQVIEGDLQEVHFRDCTLSSALFRMARFQKVVFEDCNLREADFYEADLTGVRFRRCDLRGASLLKATLKDTDLRTCQVEGIALSPDGLQGLVIEPSQAVDVVRTAGVVVTWSNE